MITSLIHKFEAGKGFRDFVDDDPNVFVLIDEAHRSQAGKANYRDLTGSSEDRS